MPELPEVETVKNKLKKEILNKKIESIEIIYENIISNVSKEEFLKKLTNQTFIDIKRLGKFLIFITEDYALLSHLRMEGKYIIKDCNKKNEKHEHIIFNMNNNRKLVYKDTRKFGRMYLKNIEDIYTTKPLVLLGPEPFSNKMTNNYLGEKFKNKTIPIKTTLLDQSIIAGLGNIYVNEVLFMSKINPLKKTNKVSIEEISKIILNSKIILEKAIKLGGTTVRTYESFNGEHGNYQDNLYVHGQTKCKKCGSNIDKIYINGRGTYYCSSCQRKKVDKE